MKFDMKLIGYEDFSMTMKSVMRSLAPPNLAACLYAGGVVILHGIQENILEQELYKEGNLYDGVTVVKVNQYQVGLLVKGPAAEYWAVHEFGYTGHITPKQRAFFWAKHIETGDDMWKALALSTDYTIRYRRGPTCGPLWMRRDARPGLPWRRR